LCEHVCLFHIISSTPCIPNSINIILQVTYTNNFDTGGEEEEDDVGDDGSDEEIQGHSKKDTSNNIKSKNKHTTSTPTYGNGDMKMFSFQAHLNFESYDDTVDVLSIVCSDCK
jgi:hypothetical protein